MQTGKQFADQLLVAFFTYTEIAPMSQNPLLRVSEALHRRRILLIGSTGFLGKVILHNLLSTSSDCEIVLLIRPGKQQSAVERLQADILSTPLFHHLEGQLGAAAFTRALNRIKICAGDITRPRFGLDDVTFYELANELDLVINSAASVNFQEPLNQALDINTYSIDQILELCRPRNIPVMHVSTCYVNGFRTGTIAETMEKPEQAEMLEKSSGRFDIDNLLGELETTIADIQHELGNDNRQFLKTMTVLGERVANRNGFNDTYTLTKWLAEQRLVQGRGNCDVTILRPSIIESSCEQPFPGWLEGVKVADAVIYAYAKSRLNSFPARKDRNIDIIPVDLVANSCVLAAAELLAQQKNRGVRVYQCCSSTSNPLSIQTLKDAVVEVAKTQYQIFPKLFDSQPSSDLRIIPPLVFNTAMGAYRGYLGLSKLINRNRGNKALNRIKTAEKLVKLFAFYASPDYEFDNSALRQLHQRFDLDDRYAYPVDPVGMDWHSYITQIHVPGLNNYALHGWADKNGGDDLIRAA